jgi:hypothetical protein
MKKILLGVVSILAGTLVALGGGWSQTFSLAAGVVAITNTQENSVWEPVAVLWSYPSAATGTIAVNRTSQGNSYMLSSMAMTGSTAVVWVTQTPYPFATGDVFRITSDVTNGVVQVIRKGE